MLADRTEQGLGESAMSAAADHQQLSSGVITAEEFEREKAKILA